MINSVVDTKKEVDQRMVILPNPHQNPQNPHFVPITNASKEKVDIVVTDDNNNKSNNNNENDSRQENCYTPPLVVARQQNPNNYKKLGQERRIAHDGPMKNDIKTAASSTSFSNEDNVAQGTSASPPLPITTKTTTSVATVPNKNIATITPSYSTSTTPLSSSSSSKRFKYLGKRKYEFLQAISLRTLSSSSTSSKSQSNGNNDNFVTIQPKALQFENGSSNVEKQNETSQSASSSSNGTDSSIIMNSTSTITNIEGKVKQVLQQQQQQQQHPKKKPTTERLEFVPSQIEYFWHCPNCIHLSFSKRPKHSVIFHGSSDNDDNCTPPSNDDYNIIEVHSYLCRLKCKEIEEKKMKGRSGNGDGGDCSSTTSSSTESSDESDEDGSIIYDIPHRTSLRLSKKKKNHKQQEAIRNEYIHQGGKSNPKKKRSKKKMNNESSFSSSISEGNLPSVTPPKRKRGRPRKYAPKSTTDSSTKKNPSSSRKNEYNSGSQVPSNSSSISPCTSTSVPRLPPPATDDLRKELVKIDIPPTDNGLIDLSNDVKITASIDYYIMSQVKVCSYILAKDSISYLRQKALPEGFPGVQCIHCDKKQWFFNSSVQLATGFPKIEQHLSGACECCPKDVKKNILIAKGQEDVERHVLRAETGNRVTRREYAQVVIERLGAPPL